METVNLTLRTWRTRRRVSQLELAIRAGTTQRHVSFIESGRSTPSRSMIIRLAESLELPIRERNEMLRAAGFAPAYPQSDPSARRLPPVQRALERVMHAHLPCPAVIVDREGDLVAANAGFRLITEGVAAHLLTPPVNVPRLLLHPDGARPRIVNLEEWGWHIVDRVTADCLRRPTTRYLQVAKELNDMAPAPPDDSSPAYLGVAVPLQLRVGDRVLRLSTALTQFGTAIDVTVSELRLEAFLPEDEETAEALSELVSGGGSDDLSR